MASSTIEVAHPNVVPHVEWLAAYGRGVDMLIGAYNFLDLAPRGRDEDGLGFPMSWVRHHDRYTQGYVVEPAQTCEEPKSSAGCCSGESHS